MERVTTPLGMVLFERAHSKDLGDFSQNIGFVYYLLDPADAKYLDIQQTSKLEHYQ